MFTRKYGTATHIYIPVPKAGSANHAVGADWTPAAGDVKISKDGGAAANVTNLPVAIAMGNSAIWDFSLTATEMQAAQVMVTVADTATKAVDDTGFIIESYGHASANIVLDLSVANVAANVTQFGGSNATASGGRPEVNTSHLAGQAVTAAAGVTFPTSVASPTNITAGTITTVTNLTNAPGAGDFTATMKTSIGTAVAASAVASVTGNVGGNVTGSVGSVVGAVGSVTGAVGSVTGAVGSVTGNVGGNVVGTVASVAGAVGSVTGNVGGSVASVVGAVGSVTGLTAANLDVAVSTRASAANMTTALAGLVSIDNKTTNLPAAPAAVGDIPTAAAIAAAHLATAVDGTVTVAESHRLANAALGGKASGLETTEATYRDLADTKDRIVATVDADGNRTAVTRDLS